MKNDEVAMGSGRWLIFNLFSVLAFKKGGCEFQKASRFNQSW